MQKQLSFVFLISEMISFGIVIRNRQFQKVDP